jgi:hypothetical protein
VLFSSTNYNAEKIDGVDGCIGGGHITNYAQNKDGEVWSLEQLSQELGKHSFDLMMSQILKNTALVYSAALASMTSENTRLAIQSGCAFELMGLDFLVDQDLKPWLLEVNSTPSLHVEHSNPSVESMIFAQKNEMVWDMFNLLQIQDRVQDLKRSARNPKWPQSMSFENPYGGWSDKRKAAEEEAQLHLSTNECLITREV